MTTTWETIMLLCGVILAAWAFWGLPAPLAPPGPGSGG